MKEYTLPLILLFIVVICCGGFYQFYVKPTTTVKPMSVKLSIDEIKTLDEAEQLLEQGKAGEAWHRLEPMRSEPLRTRLLKTEAQLKTGKSPATEIGDLEREVAKDRSLELVYVLARIHEASRDQRKARGLYEELLKASLRQELRLRVQQRYVSLCLSQKRLADAVQTLRQSAGKLLVSEDDATSMLQVIVETKSDAILEELPQLVATSTRRAVRFQFAVANAWNALKQRDKAKHCLLEALKLQPDHLPSLYVLFEFSRQGSSFDDAREYLQRMLLSGQTLPERKDWDKLLLTFAGKAHEARNLPQSFLFLKHAVFLNRSSLGADIQSILHDCESYYRENGTDNEQAFFPVFLSFANGEYALALSGAERLLKSVTDAPMKTQIEIMVRESKQAMEREQAALAKPATTSKPLPPVGVPASAPVRLASSSVRVASAPVDPTVPPTDPEEQEWMTAMKAKFKEKAEDPVALLADAKELAAARAWNGAAFYLEAILKADPHHEETLKLMARVQGKRGKHEEAVVLLEGLLQSNPQDALLRASLARNLIKTKDASRGLREARLALELDPHQLEGYVALGEYFEMRQRPTEALENVNNGLLKVTDSNAEAAQALYELKARLEKK
ncbi:MAG TPA: tetratricopeptide repeat protein [Candidatus Ozemobacteraceae bacterium]|nr:tetratricopeptide repeat protein [Candidatus Ozemobacteraceae bacterium]